eukprot:CAMPEP_0198614292 /NCGR_PEP_ID=MMETSP1462-20131121/158819_1 /TAXON_ID=1333877 /ORGANISM="Brandtodinium nutriculum, Strain RCC3387" /LENGTH=647 /DNA_ID=CAMNT_0044346093 /DNA_START=93 /DNA_END=2036 /DNA_ORIENTATION=-
MRFDARVVLRAVRSLYDDELKPTEHAILRRLREQRAITAALARKLPVDAVDPETMPQVDRRRLRSLCEGMHQLRVVAEEEGAGYSVRLLDRPESFADASGDADAYPPELWTELAAHVVVAQEAGWCFPGGDGPYWCARALVARSLPCLHGLSLGRVCQVVQVAISRKTLLGYRDGSLAPLRASLDCYEDRRMPSVEQPAGRLGLSVASLYQVRAGMRQLLYRHEGGVPLSDLRHGSLAPLLASLDCQERRSMSSLEHPEGRLGLSMASLYQVRAGMRQLLYRHEGGVPLSDLGGLFGSLFGLDLEETALGRGGLGCLLGGPWFRDICQLEHRGPGRTHVHRASVPPHAGVPAPALGDAPLPAGDVAPGQGCLCMQEDIELPRCLPSPRSALSCFPTCPSTQSPRPCMLGEDGPGSEALVLPGALFCRAEGRRTALRPASRGSGGECGGKLSSLLGEGAASPASTAASSVDTCDMGDEFITAAEVVWRVKNTFIDVSDDGEHTDDEGLSVRRARTLPACSPARPLTLPLGPDMLGESGPEAEAGDPALALPGASLCLGRWGYTALDPDTWGSEAKCGEESVLSPANTAVASARSSGCRSGSIGASGVVWCVKNTFVHVSDDDEHADDEGLTVRPPRKAKTCLPADVLF